MKKVIFTLCFLLFARFIFAQWTTSGNNIYNTNSGYVGIGTSAPITPLDVYTGINVSLTSTNHLGAYNIGFTNDYGTGAAAQYILLIPYYNGIIGENGAGMSGVLRAYRGNSVSYNAFQEYSIIAQTAYNGSAVNMVPLGGFGPLNIYSVTYQGSPYLAVLGSDLSRDGAQCTFTGYYWNDINTFKPQMVLASQCSNVSVIQNTSFIGGAFINANVNGNVGVGVGVTNPQASLHVGGEAVSPDANFDYSGDLLIQANTGTRSTTQGAELEFVIPANTDGTNFWGQGRILTVPANTNTGDATGKMIMGTRRLFNKAGTGTGWYYGNDIVIDGSGNVGIGTLSPQSLLSVKGTITAMQLNVTQSNWADFVFDRGYRPMPLEEIGRYVVQNHHLPQMPTAADIEQHGLDVGAMQKLQIMKIEELTLYAIEADKHASKQDSLIEQQQSLLLQMQTQLKMLQAEIDRLKAQGNHP